MFSQFYNRDCIPVTNNKEREGAWKLSKTETYISKQWSASKLAGGPAHKLQCSMLTKMYADHLVRVRFKHGVRVGVILREKILSHSPLWRSPQLEALVWVYLKNVPDSVSREGQPKQHNDLPSHLSTQPVYGLALPCPSRLMRARGYCSLQFISTVWRLATKRNWCLPGGSTVYKTFPRLIKLGSRIASVRASMPVKNIIERLYLQLDCILGEFYTP